MFKGRQMNSFSRRLIWCMLVISKISWLIRIFPFPPGPKAILSSAISNALAEFFVVDATTIESNLVSDAKISLKNVQLREQVHRLPVNSVGKSTKITITIQKRHLKSASNKIGRFASGLNPPSLRPPTGRESRVEADKSIQILQHRS